MPPETSRLVIMKLLSYIGRSNWNRFCLWWRYPQYSNILCRISSYCFCQSSTLLVLPPVWLLLKYPWTLKLPFFFKYKSNLMGTENFAFILQDNNTDSIIHRIQQSIRGLKQGPTGKNLSSTEKRKFLVNTVSAEILHSLFVLYCLIILHQTKAIH